MKPAFQILLIAILLVGVLQGCKKSINNGSGSGSGTTTPTDTTKTLASPYYFTCNINGVAKSFATDAGCVLAEAPYSAYNYNGFDSVYIRTMILQGVFRSYKGTVLDSVESLLIEPTGGDFLRLSGGDFSYFLGTYTNSSTSVLHGGDSSVNSVSVISEVNYVSYGYGPYYYGYTCAGKDSAKLYPFSLTVTAIDAKTIKGSFSGTLTNYSSFSSSGTVTNNSSEKITNGAFYMPYTK